MIEPEQQYEHTWHMVLVLAVLALMLGGYCVWYANQTDKADRQYIKQHTATTVLNGSSDGRFHSCGYVTEQGVTEHLAA